MGFKEMMYIFKKQHTPIAYHGNMRSSNLAPNAMPLLLSAYFSLDTERLGSSI